LKNKDERAYENLASPLSDAADGLSEMQYIEELPIGLNKEKPIIAFNSLFLFESTNIVRCSIHYLLNLRYFETFIMIVILCSSIALATEDPVDENSAQNHYLNYLDYFFTAVFAIEMILKVGICKIIFITKIKSLIHRFKQN